MFTKTSIKLFSQSISETISKIKRSGENLFAITNSAHKRHSVYQPVESSSYEQNLKRKNAFDYINNFVSVVLPKVESFVERRLLEKFKTSLDPKERELVEDAYRLRHYKAQKQIVQKPQSALIESSPDENNEIDLENIFSAVNGKGFKYHTFDDIGKYVLFPAEVRKEIFPLGFYGYYQKEFLKTKMYSLMIREEGVKLAHAFSSIKTHDERLALIDFEGIFNKTFNFKEELKKFETFSLFFQEIAYSLNTLLIELNNHEYTYLFENAEIFDGLVTILTKNLRKNPFGMFMMIPEVRYKVLEKIVKDIHSKLGNNWKYKSAEIKSGGLKVTEKEYFPLTRFNDIIEEFKIFRFEFDYEDLFKFAQKIGVNVNKSLFTKPTVNFTLYLTTDFHLCEYQWRPEELRGLLPGWKGFNTGVLLNGEPGCGKSMVLAYLHAWARENRWVVIPMSDIKKFTQGGFPIERHLSGLYLLQELASNLLREVKIINYDVLRDIPIDMKDYGNFDTAGNKIGSVEPVPILWDERRQVYTDSWKEFNSTPEEEIILEDYPHHNLKLKDFLHSPNNLLELVNFGIDNMDFSTCVIAEVLNVLQKSEKTKTMIIVDEYNELYRPTSYLSYKYANIGGKIPPYDFAMLRMLMRFDTHLFKQGVKVCAVSMTSYDRHVFKPEAIKFPKGYDMNVEGMRLNDFRNAMEYYMSSGFVTENYHELEIQEAYQLCQGNWKQMHHDLSYYFRMLPAIGHYEAKKQVDKFLKEKKKFR